MNEIKAILDSSDAPETLKAEALGKVFPFARGAAEEITAQAAGGEVLAIMLRVIQAVLPVLLDGGDVLDAILKLLPLLTELAPDSQVANIIAAIVPLLKSLFS